MRRDLLVTTPPAGLEAGVNSIVRSIVVKRMGSEGSPKITLHSWRVRYWSFLRRVSVSNGKLKSFTVWLKIPKRDPSCRDLAQVLEDPKQRQAAHDEAKAYLDLAQVFGKADSPDPVSFVTV